MPENKIRYGLSNVHLAIVTEDAVTGAITYAAPKAIKGAVNISIKPVGDVISHYADNIEYFRATANNGYDGDIEITEIPEWFDEEVLGDTLVATDNVTVENAGNIVNKKFALLYQFEGDVKARRHVLYYCNVARPEIAGKTKGDKIEPDTSKLTFSARPNPKTMDVKASTRSTTSQAVYDGWFASVYEKAGA